MGLFSSFIYPSNSFLSWINKSTLGLAGVWTFILSYFFAISFRRLLYWTVLSTSKFFPENSHITFYLFSESKKYSAISAVHWNVFFFSLWVSVSLPYVFFFLLRGYRKFWLSTKVSTFSAAILFQGDQRSWIPERVLEFTIFLWIPWILLLNVQVIILCWIVVPKFVWSTFAHQRSLTSVIYAQKKWFSCAEMIQLKLPFCCRDRIDIANMLKDCHFQAAWLTESRFKDCLQSQPVITTAYCMQTL